MKKKGKFSDAASIDPRFAVPGFSPDNIAIDILKAEIAKYNGNGSASTYSIERKKNIIFGIAAAISIIMMVLSQIIHVGWLPGIISAVFILVISFGISLNLDLETKLLDELKHRPDEPIENIVAAAGPDICKSKTLLRTGVYVILVGLLPAAYFSQNHIFYDTAPEGKYVSCYTDGILDKKTTLTIPETVDGMEVKGIRNEAFKNTSITSISLPNTIDSIGGYAFEGCSSLSEIDLPENLRHIGGYAFAGCSSLSEIKIPKNITEIRGHTFEGCTSLSSVKIPKTVMEIRSSAFRDCPNLRNIELPQGCEVNERAFKDSPTNIRYTK